MIKTLLISLGVLAAFTGAEVDTYEVETGQSQVIWKARKVTGAHEGTVSVQSGSFRVEDEKLVGGSFVIDMRTINVTDLSGESKGKLEGHLKSPDFFSVQDFGTASFVITKVTPQGDQHKIDGVMVVKNIAQDVSFVADVKMEKGQVMATADIKLDRSKFDVRYGSGSFFDNLGDNLIYDEFDLSISLVASM
ncbi:MAG: YceI family protein [Bacteroidota bacterium]